jgi:hypothetical protein
MQHAIRVSPADLELLRSRRGQSVKTLDKSVTCGTVHLREWSLSIALGTSQGSE